MEILEIEFCHQINFNSKRVQFAIVTLETSPTYTNKFETFSSQILY